MPSITPNLWFDTEAEEAAEFYVSIFPNSRVTGVLHHTASGQEGNVLTVDWELDGKPFTGINGGPQFEFNEAVSLLITCEDQDEVDYYWEQLTEGGEEGPCGWVKDRYGLSWQVVPKAMYEILTGGDRERARRAMEAMYGMRKLDVAQLQRAAGGEPVG